VIPGARLGQLEDHVTNFWANPGDEKETKVRYLFVEIEKQANGAVGVVVPNPPPRHLDQELGIRHPIVQHIKAHLAAEQAPTEPAVPWEALYDAFLIKAAEQGWDRHALAYPTVEQRREVETYLTQVNGAYPPPGASNVVYWMTQYRCAVNDMDRFLQVVRDAHADTLKDMQEMAHDPEAQGGPVAEIEPSESTLKSTHIPSL
jgi:hypothetical protein